MEGMRLIKTSFRRRFSNYEQIGIFEYLLVICHSSPCFDSYLFSSNVWSCQIQCTNRIYTFNESLSSESTYDVILIKLRLAAKWIDYIGITCHQAWFPSNKRQWKIRQTFWWPWPAVLILRGDKKETPNVCNTLDTPIVLTNTVYESILS